MRRIVNGRENKNQEMKKGRTIETERSRQWKTADRKTNRRTGCELQKNVTLKAGKRERMKRRIEKVERGAPKTQKQTEHNSNSTTEGKTDRNNGTETETTKNVK